VIGAQGNSYQLSNSSDDFPFPLFYLHVPKCGSSFANTIAHWACSEADLDPNRDVKEPSFNLGPTCKYTSKFARFASGHAPLKETDLSHLQSAVAVFREPRQRIMSGFYHNLHDCGPLRQKTGCDQIDPLTGCSWLYENVSMALVKEYAGCVKNCYTNMLTGSNCHREGAVDSYALAAAGDIAASRVRQFAFVGLTEEYDLSVCLWHAMFGGKCYPNEFHNLRPGRQTSASEMYDTAFIGLGEDEFKEEDAIYAVAKEVFWSNVHKYGVNRQTCAKICPEPAMVFQGDSLSLAWSHNGQFDYDWPGRLRYVAEDPLRS
jgi:hypothetical protein